jgi:hypothetical protein
LMQLSPQEHFAEKEGLIYNMTSKHFFSWFGCWAQKFVHYFVKSVFEGCFIERYLWNCKYLEYYDVMCIYICWQ